MVVPGGFFCSGLLLFLFFEMLSFCFLKCCLFGFDCVCFFVCLEFLGVHEDILHCVRVQDRSPLANFQNSPFGPWGLWPEFACWGGPQFPLTRCRLNRFFSFLFPLPYRPTHLDIPFETPVVKPATLPATFFESSIN